MTLKQGSSFAQQAMPRNVKSVLLALALFSAAASARAGFESCPHIFADGLAPRVSENAPARQRELCFDSFAVLHSGQSKTPVYVAEKLSRASVQDAKYEQRTERFYEEARLPLADRSHLRDYTASMPDGRRFDRGHQAPAGDMSDASAMAQSFSLANIVPQAPHNNRKAWASIEKATRKYVLRAKGPVYVITGPVYSGPVDVLGAGGVWIPKYLFKLVYDPAAHRAWAHWLENTNDARVGRPISYQELVQRTGTEFLPSLHCKTQAASSRPTQPGGTPTSYRPRTTIRLSKIDSAQTSPSSCACRILRNSNRARWT